MAPGNGPNRDPVENNEDALDILADAANNDSGAGAGGGGGSGSQATAIENQLVARAWIATSENPTVSSDQTGEHFHLTMIKTYWKMAKDFVVAKRKGWEKISLDRAENFPKGQFVRIRQATYLCISVRKQNPKTSGDNNKVEWYKRIRPIFVEKLKSKKLAATKPERFEVVADYLQDKPKFMLHMNKEVVQRPKGKRAAQQSEQIAAAKKQVMESEGVPDGKLSVLDGGAATGQGIQAMSQLLDRVVAHNSQLMQTAMQQQQTSQMNQMRALVLALNPNAVSAYDSFLGVPPMHAAGPIVQQQQQQPDGNETTAVGGSGNALAVDLAEQVVRNAANNNNKQPGADIEDSD